MFKMKLNINDGVSANLFLFRCIGHWPVGNTRIYKLYSRLVYIGMLLYNLTGFMYLLKNIDNTDEVSATAFNLMSTVAVVVKAYYFDKNVETIKDIVKIFEREEFQPRNDKQREIIKRGVFTSKVIFHYFMWSAQITLFFWLFFPIMDKERRLPSKAWFPYDYLSTSFYAPTYVGQSIFILYHDLNNVAMDTLFAILMRQTASQCDALNEQVSSLGLENPNDPESVRRDLVKCIIRHKLILKLTDFVGKAFGKIIFVQYICCVLVLCDIMFLMSLIQTLNATFIMLFFYQSSVFTELCLYCWFGNQVMVKSEKLATSAFVSSWYNYPESYKKDLLFFMLRVQKPIVLFVGNIFPINLTAFTALLRSSWAYFMALRKIHEKS